MKINVRYRAGYHNVASVYNKQEVATMTCIHENIEEYEIQSGCLRIVCKDESECWCPLTSIVRWEIEH